MFNKLINFFILVFLFNITPSYSFDIKEISSLKIGEGDGYDLPRRRVIRGEQMREAPSEYPGLAGPCAGDDQQRPTSMFHRSLLRRIEVLDQRLGVHYHPILSAPCDSRIVQPTVESRRSPDH